MPRILAVALAAAVLVLSPTTAALADDLNSGDLTYSGTIASEFSSHEGTLTVACAGGVCVLPWDPATGDLVFVDGVATIDVPDKPLDCSNSGDGRGYGGEIRLTEAQLVGSYSVLARDVSSCPGFAEGTVLPEVVTTVDFTLVRGRACLIDASCRPPTAEEALAQSGGVFEPGARNDVALPPGGDRPFTAPTDLSQVATFGDVATLFSIIWVGGATLLLFVLVIIPVAWGGTALNRLAARVRSASRRRRGLEDDAARPGLRGWRWAALGVVAAAVITSFADPNLGVDAAAIRVVLTIAAAFAVSIVAGWVVAMLLVRAVDRQAVPTVRFTPLSLIVVVGAAAVTRLSGFDPPIVYGFVAAVAFGGVVSAARTGRIALLTLTWAFLIGVGAWFLYSGLDAADPGLVVVRELLAATALAGISALPVALLPVPGLPGAAIWMWRKLVWFPVYLVALFAFVLVLLPMPALTADAVRGYLPTIGIWVLASVLASVVGIGLLLASTILRARDKRRAQA